MKKATRFLIFFVCCLFVFSVAVMPLSAKEAFPLEGKGTVNEPYLIQDKKDLSEFRDLVNGGRSFAGQYVQQTADIDLGENEIWEPIGDWGRDLFFYGVYNGGGHVLYNLNTESAVSGLFSCLGGAVINLGIESGTVRGEYVGAISSQTSGYSGVVINCYSMADVSGIRAGGIAENFFGGTIIDSWCAGKVQGTDAVGGVTSYGVSKAWNCSYFGDESDFSTHVEDQLAGVEQCVYDTEKIDSLKQKFRENARKNMTVVGQLLGGVEGLGTEEEPFLISSHYDLARFREIVNIGYNFDEQWFRQTDDIDLSAFENWTPIGKGEADFDGVYDGAGNSIKNLTVKGDDNDAVALFGNVGGVILNLGIESGRVEGKHAAALVGAASGNIPMIINCYNNAEVCGSVSAAGIVNTFSTGIVVNCLNTGYISAEEYEGGICARSVRRMLNCHSVGIAVAPDNIDGTVIRSTCSQVESVSDAVKLLNGNLYGAATFTNYQKNNLVKWSYNGTLSGEYHNYFALYLIRFVLVSALILCIILFVMMLYNTAKMKNKVSLAGIKQTVAFDKQRLTGSLDSRLSMIIWFGFLVTLVLLVSSYINGNNSITREFGFSSAALYDFIVPMRSALNDNIADNGYYFVLGETYPPIARLVIFCVGKLLPADTQFVWESQMKSGYGTFVIMLFVIVCLALLYMACSRLNEKNILLLSVLAVFSSPMLFMIDRANVLCLVVALSAFFVAGYRSENSVIRHLSYVCLALAASIKIYPVVLGLLVLREKKWKHTIQCVIYGAAFCILPFFVIGLDELALYIRNLTTTFNGASVGVSEWLVDYGNLMRTWFYKLFDNAELGEAISKYTLYLVTLLLVGCALVARERWKAVTAVMFIQILYPAFTVYYCLSLLAIPMLMFVSDKHERKIDYVYATSFMLVLVPLQFLCGALGFVRQDLWLFGGTVGFILAIVLIADCSVDFVKRVREWRKNKASVELSKNTI